MSIYNSLTRLSFFALAMLCTYLLLFNFQWPSLPALADSLAIIPQHFAFVNTFFQSFSDFLILYFAWFVFSSGIFEISHTIHFCIVLCVSSLVLLFNFQWPTPLSVERPCYYTVSLIVCQVLFENFFKFSSAALQPLFLDYRSPRQPC